MKGENRERERERERNETEGEKRKKLVSFALFSSSFVVAAKSSRHAGRADFILHSGGVASKQLPVDVTHASFLLCFTILVDRNYVPLRVASTRFHLTPRLYASTHANISARVRASFPRYSRCRIFKKFPQNRRSRHNFWYIFREGEERRLKVLFSLDSFLLNVEQD